MAYREFTKKEMQWIKSFERIMKNAPSSLFLFVGSGINIHPKNGRERYVDEHGSMDREAPVYPINTPMDYDGGDY